MTMEELQSNGVFVGQAPDVPKPRNEEEPFPENAEQANQAQAQILVEQEEEKGMTRRNGDELQESNVEIDGGSLTPLPKPRTIETEEGGTEERGRHGELGYQMAGSGEMSEIDLRTEPILVDKNKLDTGQFRRLAEDDSTSYYLPVDDDAVGLVVGHRETALLRCLSCFFAKGRFTRGIGKDDALRTQWKAKWDGFLEAVSLGSYKASSPWRKDTTFSIVLRLYAHRPVLNELDDLFVHRPKELMFYLPQLCNFLLRGVSAESQALELFLLDKSEKSLRFAHKLYWFLLSFGPDHPKFKTWCEATQQRGIIAAKRLGELEPTKPAPPRTPPNVNDRQQNVFERPLSRVAAGPPYIIGTSQFEWMISFCNELTHIGEALKQIPVAHRNGALRNTLASLVEDYFPSNVMCLPIGKRNCRVVGVVAEESFCFKTNERVPFMICLEVIDDSVSRDAAEEYHDDSEDDDDASVSTRARLDEYGQMLRDGFGKLGHQMEEWGSKLARQVGSNATTTTKPSMKQPFSPLRTTSPPFRYDSDDFNDSDRHDIGGEDSDTGYGSNMQRARSLGGSPYHRLSDERGIVDNTTNLGQWKARTNRARGAGFSHFEYHQDYEWERGRRAVRKKILEIGETRNHRASSDFAAKSTKKMEMEMTQLEIKDGESEARMQGQGGIEKAQGRDEEEEAVAADDEREGEDNEEDDYDYDSESETDTSLIDDGSQSKGKDEPMVIFQEGWKMKQERIRPSRHWGQTHGWRLVPVIVKSGDDLRQEQFALQLIAQFDRIFREQGLNLWLRPYEVLSTCTNAGIIEAVPDTISLDSLKKNDPNFISLKDFFHRYYGSGKAFRQARRRFCESLAAYCIVSYLLKIKDRHNGNLLLHSQGYIIHIDFGFMFCNSPGNMNFESAPFKLTNEFVQLLGGPESSTFARFRRLCVQGFLAARKRREHIILLVEMMRAGNEGLPCFQAPGGGAAIVHALTDRFKPDLSKSACIEFVNDLIDTSINHWRTRWYDMYQRCWVGIAY